MRYNTEKIFHFTCEKCAMWWSVAAENMNVSKRSWICTWCGNKHSPPHIGDGHRDGLSKFSDLGPPISKDNSDRGSW